MDYMRETKTVLSIFLTKDCKKFDWTTFNLYLLNIHFIMSFL